VWLAVDSYFLRCAAACSAPVAFGRSFVKRLVDSIRTRMPTSDTVTSPSLQFLHITKCGGTAIENYGRRQGFRWGRFFKDRLSGPLRPPHTGLLRSELFHIPPKYFENNPYEGYDLFAVVRDPLERAISEFRCPWKGFCAPAKTVAARARRAAATKEDLNSWLLAKTRKGAMCAPFTNGHFIPQSEYLLNDRRELVVPRERILRFENLTSDFRRLCEEREIPVGELLTANASEMPRFEVEDLDQDVLHALRTAYDEDFALLDSLR
jgi:Sulfotransferase family